ncbi:MAG: proteobacterial dedicated sortase system response regulator [Pseudomonadota bacterium]
MSRHIAIVEDEPDIRANYSAAFTRLGYRVSTYGNREDALRAFRDRLPELVIVDVGLGDDVEGGFELCRELRGMSKRLPVIFLTARDSELDVISGLRLGADDYLTKDISIAHLTTRVVALLRRVDALTSQEAAEDVLERGKLRLDVDRMHASWDGEEVPLTLTEFWIVHALARYPGHVKNRQQLMEAANVVFDDSTVTSQVKRIRRKFVAADQAFDAIETVYGMGYRWLDGR